METDDLQAWVGRTSSVTDRAATGPLAGLAALLDHAEPPWPQGCLPPLAHWLYFLERERESRLDVDGHPRRGEFLPPISLPRRMWASSRVVFLRPIALDALMVRRSTIAGIRSRSGRTGELAFVTIDHEISVDGEPALREQQELVFRAAAAYQPGAPLRPSLEPGARRRVVPSATLLFRFSALTFNAHRIHYDRDYARNIEGYPGLVVHGPLIATLLMDHCLCERRDQPVREFAFRAQRPLFDTAPFDLNLALAGEGAGADADVELWATDDAGALACSATVTP